MTNSTSILGQQTRPIDLVEYGTTSDTIDLRIEDYRIAATDYGRFLDILPQANGGYRIKARQYVGVIQLPGAPVIRIQPKVGMTNFLRLLNYVYADLPVLFDQTSHFKEVDELIEYLIRVFIFKTEELYRKSYRRSYLTRSEALSGLRGRPKVNETLRYMRLFKPKIFCEFDEFTGDILINRIIKFACFKLLSYKKELISYKLQRVYSLFDEVSIEEVSAQQLDNIVYDRLTESYRPLHHLCRLFIENVYLSHRLGERPMFCFLVDMEMLFENYVREVLRLFSNNQVLEQPSNKYLDESKRVQVKPDIQIKKDNRVCLVLDCKYKLRASLPDDNEKLGIINSDIYQLLSYLIAYSLKTGVLVYPEGEISGDDEISIRVGIDSYRIYPISLDLNQTDEGYLRDFVGRIESLIV